MLAVVIALIGGGLIGLPAAYAAPAAGEIDQSAWPTESGNGPITGTPTTSSTFTSAPGAGDNFRAVQDVGHTPAVSPAQPPDAPTNIRIVYRGTLVVYWDTDPSLSQSARYYVISEKEAICVTSDVSHSCEIAVTPGQTYSLTVVVRNEHGFSPPSQPLVFTAPTAPATPAEVTATPEDRNVRLAWSPNTPDRSRFVYEVEYSSNGRDWNRDTSTQMSPEWLVMGLTNGATYSFRVRATNQVGTGPWSQPIHATPRTTPSAPAITQATPGDGQAEVTWSPPTDNGGETVSSYEIESTTDNQTWVSSGSTNGNTTTTVSGLINGASYSFRVRAVNAAGPGPWSELATTNPRTQPTSPTLHTATPSDARVGLDWDAPTDGGAAIENYDIQSSTDGTEWNTIGSTTGETSFNVLDLTNGTRYSFQVRAVNAAGPGTWSEAVTATPRTIPDAVETITSGPLDVGLELGWHAPNSDGGSPVTGYLVEFSTDRRSWGLAGSTTGETRLTVSDLTNGTTYFFRVRAINATGEGPWGVIASAIPRTTPAAPAFTAATPGVGLVDLTWQSPADGGTAITSYQLEFSTNGENWTFAGATSHTTTLQIDGLSNGTAHSFRVRAVNGAGAGPWSETTTATPHTIPNAPSTPSTTPGHGEANLTWKAPDFDGGSPVLGYEVGSSTDGRTWASAGSTSGDTMLTVGGLTNGTGYSFRVRAINTAGPGLWSESAAATPRTTPAAPVIATTTPGDGQVDLSWDAPADGGSVVTGYELETSPDEQTWTVVGSTSGQATLTVTELTNGVAYSFRVRAVNVAGAGEWSTTTTTTPRTIAGAPPWVGLTPGASTVTMEWAAPASDGGTPVTGYELEASTDQKTWTTAGSTTGATTLTVGDLTNGTAHSFRVRALNTAGAGEWGPVASATPRTTSAAPTDLTGTPGIESVALTWTAPTADGGATISGYEVETSTDSRTWNPAGQTSASELTVAGLNNGTTYAFRVRALNAAGPGTWSATTQATPRTTPSTPSELTASGANEAIDLAWTTPANGGSPITSYEIEETTNGTTWTPAGTTNTTEVTITGLRNADTYTYRVRAVNAAGTGAWSGDASAVPLPTTSPFIDVTTTSQFYREIVWLARKKISTGWDNGDGTASYQPLAPINRDAMAAFLYRQAGHPTYTPPATSPFRDVAPGDQFYKEIAWLAERGISTGWDNGDGTKSYRPLAPIARDAMAAFLHRAAGSPTITPPAVSPFTDLAPGAQFYAEITWMHHEGISTGWAGNDGTHLYQPLNPVNRDAMAAFLYRYTH